MSSNAVRTILESRLNDSWDDRTLIFWDNENEVPSVGLPFIRATLHGVYSETISLKCRRDFDLFSIQVFTPKGSGAGENMELCDALLAIFYGYASEGLVCKRVLSVRVGKEKEWYNRLVQVETEYDFHIT